MDIVTRLKQLAHAVADEDWSEFSMRVPADSERDADLVLLRASKEIESLRAELAECRAKHMDDLLVLSETAKAERELRAELAECKRDAERYRWVRQRLEVRMMANMRGGSAAALATRVGHAFFHSSVSPAPIKAERLDAAIDAALAAEGEK